MLRKLFFLTIIGVVIIGFLYYKNVSVVRDKVDEAIEESERRISEIQGIKTNAIREARSLLDEKLKRGYDLENRPCLSEEIVIGWAVDIVHQPLEEVDKLPKNQCQSHLEGKVRNLILMDEYGHLVDDGIRIGF